MPHVFAGTRNRPTRQIEGKLHLQCTCCEQWKCAQDNFYRLATTRHGYSSWCKTCTNRRRTERRREQAAGSPAPARGRLTRLVDGVIHLWCTRCRIWKPEDQFWAASAALVGRYARCRICAGAEKKNRQNTPSTTPRPA